MYEIAGTREGRSKLYIYFCKRFIKKDFLRPLYFYGLCPLAAVLAEDLGIENECKI